MPPSVSSDPLTGICPAANCSPWSTSWWLGAPTPRTLMCSGRGRRLWVLSHRVMVPSALGMFLCAFPFGHVRPLDAVLAAVRGRA